MKSNQKILTALAIAGASLISSPSFSQNKEEIEHRLSIELVDTLGLNDVSGFNIEWVERMYGKNQMLLFMQHSLLEDLNNIRKENNLSELTLDSTLTVAAQKYAEEMYTNARYNHIGKNGSRPMKRAKESGYMADLMLENIGYNYTSFDDAIDHWRNSPPHFKSMTDPDVIHLGVGYCNGYRVNMFGRRPE